MAGTMKRMHLLFETILICLLCLLPSGLSAAQEKVLASYFDILVDSPEGTEVTGRIHLERNKDVHTMPVPEGYHFEILRQPEEALFRIETRYDLSKRMMGVLAVDKGKSTPSAPPELSDDCSPERRGQAVGKVQCKRAHRKADIVEPAL